ALVLRRRVLRVSRVPMTRREYIPVGLRSASCLTQSWTPEGPARPSVIANRRVLCSFYPTLIRSWAFQNSRSVAGQGVPGPCLARDGQTRAHTDVLVACPGTP